MTIRQNPPAGAPCWVDLMSSDVEAATAFYGELFGWTGSINAEFGGYVTFALDGEGVAGLMLADPQAPARNVWNVYLHAPDIAATVAAARANGGGVHVDVMPVGDLGSMAFVTDPGQAAVGLWQPGLHRGGVVGKDNAPCHFELATRDYDAVLPFYKALFGWDPEAIAGEMRYAVQRIADGEHAAIMDAASFLPEGVPAHWAVYFAVDDVDKALAKVESLGGSSVQPPMDTPYGRLATAADSLGSVFKLRAAPA